jgi:hypothetical protein
MLVRIASHEYNCRMLRALRFSGLLVVHTTVAIMATAIAVHSIWKVVPAYSISAVLWKECISSAVCAMSIGFGVWRIRQTSVEKWTWVPAAVWFALGFLISRGDVWGSLLPVRSGSVFDAPDARSFFVFTVPLIRATFYSIGAYTSSMIFSGKVTARNSRV